LRTKAYLSLKFRNIAANAGFVSFSYLRIWVLREKLLMFTVFTNFMFIASDQKFYYVLFIMMPIEASGQSFGAYQEHL
jgi:hypothetical protein